jgi:heme exporter protein D
LWLPLALQALGDLQDNDVNPIVYVFLATGLTVAGLVMVFTPSSNEYYLLTRQRRQNRRAGRRAKGRVQL